jgi:amino acid permease
VIRFKPAATRLYGSEEDSDQSSAPSPAASSSSNKGDGTATVSQEIFNLVKSIVGAGVLAIPAGIAAFGNAPSAVFPAVALIIGIGCLSSYGFGLIGRVCSLTATGSFRTAWSASVSEETSWIPAWSVTLKTVFATLAYSMILGDTFQSLLLTAGVSLSKTTVLTAVTVGLLLPLCLLKNLSSLAPFSLLGSLGMIYTCIAMGVRYFGGDYLKGGKFAVDTAAAFRPRFGSLGARAVWTPKSAILIGMLSTSYMAHFNAPKFYTELKNNTVPRYMAVVWTSFAASILLYCLMGSLGFLTFGSASSGT